MTLHLHPGRENPQLLLLLFLGPPLDEQLFFLLSSCLCNNCPASAADAALNFPSLPRAFRPLLCNFFGATKWKLLVYNGSSHLKTKVAKHYFFPILSFPI